MKDKIKILYVEDEKHIRDELLEIFELDFNHTLVAADGEEGLRLYKQHSPDLVISDIQMPKMNGLVMCEKIKETNKDAKIILTTAFNEETYLQEAKRLQIFNYIKKPININEMYTAIRTLLESARTEDKE